jgi:VCBS repeat-containing protein
VIDRALNTPPGSPAEGDTYIVGTAPTGAWSTYGDYNIALYTAGAWVRIIPQAGWLAYVQDEDLFYYYDVSVSPDAWSVLTTGGGVAAYQRSIYYIIDWLDTPPGGPAANDSYLVDTAPTGAWSAFEEGSVAVYDGVSWIEITPKVGDLFYGDWDNAWRYWTSVVGPHVWTDLVPLPPLTAPGYTDVRVFAPGSPATGALLYRYNPAGSLDFPADFGPDITNDLEGAVGSITSNPTATYDIDVQKNGTSIGTVSISTAGAFTFTTDANAPQSLAIGDVLDFVAPTADGTIADISFTLPAILNP